MRRTVTLAALTALMAGCAEKAPPEEIRPVRATVAAASALQDIRSGTGRIEARQQADLGFRSAGRMLERPVMLGQQVRRGQVLAVLDDDAAHNQVAALEAQVAAARASAVEARRRLERQRILFGQGYATQATIDREQTSLESAEANLRAAQAQLHTGREQLAETRLVAPFSGVVTAIGAEPGQVVQPGMMVVQIAEPGEREAVFFAAEEALAMARTLPEVDIFLARDRQIQARGRVRSVAPAADVRTGTYEIRVALPTAPPEMELGASVVGALSVPSEARVRLPASALHHSGGRPAIWIVDRRTGQVALRPVEVERLGSDEIVIRSGAPRGALVVTAGVNTLRPGQRVRVIGVS